MKQRNMYRRSFHVKATRSRKCGKRRYRSSIEAKIALADIQMKDSTNRAKQELRTYYCKHCSGWHLTSKPYREHEHHANADNPVNHRRSVHSDNGTVNRSEQQDTHAEPVDAGTVDTVQPQRHESRHTAGCAPLPSMVSKRIGSGLHVEPVIASEETEEQYVIVETADADTTIADAEHNGTVEAAN